MFCHEFWGISQSSYLTEYLRTTGSEYCWELSDSVFFYFLVWYKHCMKKCLYSALFWSTFSRIWTEYGPEYTLNTPFLHSETSLECLIFLEDGINFQKLLRKQQEKKYNLQRLWTCRILDWNNFLKVMRRRFIKIHP